jgi:hypothetical protein
LKFYTTVCAMSCDTSLDTAFRTGCAQGRAMEFMNNHNGHQNRSWLLQNLKNE